MAAPAPTSTQDALYNETVARLQHQRETTLAGDKEGVQKAEAEGHYNEGLLAQKEPLSYKANQHRANAGGVLESGVNAERRGTIGTEYANRRGAITKAIQASRDAASKADANAEYEYGSNSAAAANAAQRRAEEQTLKNPTNELGPANKGGVKTITGPEEQGGVVPYHETSSKGSVTVGGPLNARRRAAIAQMKKMGVG